jgi:hypothetical protein
MTKIPDTKKNGSQRRNDAVVKPPVDVKPQPVQKRFMLIIQHEVVVYAEDEKTARANLLRSPFAKERTKLQIVFAQEIPMHERIPIIEDYRKAPGT